VGDLVDVLLSVMLGYHTLLVHNVCDGSCLWCSRVMSGLIVMFGHYMCHIPSTSCFLSDVVGVLRVDMCDMYNMSMCIM